MKCTDFSRLMRLCGKVSIRCVGLVLLSFDSRLWFLCHALPFTIFIYSAMCYKKFSLLLEKLLNCYSKFMIYNLLNIFFLQKVSRFGLVGWVLFFSFAS